MALLPLDLLKQGASELGIELSDAQLDQYDRFALMLIEANRQFNLTRITEPKDIVLNHYLDSLLYLWAQDAKTGARVIDVGAGAGFPGVPVKIVRPDVSITLLDGTFKKVRFLSDVIEKLGLARTDPVHARAEELAHEKDHRERYDLAYARALSDLKALAELCLPFVRIGGYVVASKGGEIDEEIKAARPIIGQLGGNIEKTVRTHIPGTDIQRSIVVMVKIKQTPAQFPRAYSRIAQKKRG